MFNDRLAGGHLYGKQLLTWLSLMMSLIASFVLSLFPLDVLDEIWDLIESVSEGFLTYPLSNREEKVHRTHDKLIQFQRNAAILINLSLSLSLYRGISERKDFAPIGANSLL